jgi:hypothetical protein
MRLPRSTLRLQVGAATETITVHEGVELVEPSNSTVGSLIPAEAIDRVPLVSRNVYDLIQLSAGVNAVNGSPNSSDSMQSIQNISVGRPGVDVSADTINGSLVGSVYYMVDGAPIGICRKQLRRHYSRHGNPRRWRGGSARRNAEYSGLLLRAAVQESSAWSPSLAPTRSTATFLASSVPTPGRQRLFQQGQ